MYSEDDIVNRDKDEDQESSVDEASGDDQGDDSQEDDDTEYSDESENENSDEKTSSQNNFINECVGAGIPLSNGRQVAGRSCNSIRE